MKKLIFLLIFSSFVWGQGAQLPKYKVSTLPTASLYPTYTVQVTDGLTAIDCTSGGGTFNVLCTSHGGAWNSVAQASGTTTNALTMNNSGSGAASGTTFNGSAAQTISYNTIGAAPTASPTFTGTVTMPAPTLNNVTGSTQCLHANLSGVVSGTGSDCGSAGGSGVQFNPSTAIIAYGGSSTNEDDGRVTSSAIPLGSWSCNGTTCTFNTTGTNPLTTSDWVDVSSATSWFAPPVNLGVQDTGVGTFKVTAATSSTFTFAYTTNTGSGSGGNAYSASYWAAYQTAAMPYINGHGSFYWRFGQCVDLANSTIFTARFGSLSGTPKLLFIQGCQNDLQAGKTDVQVEGYLQQIWANAHAAGYIVFQSTMLPTALGITPAANFYTYMMNINNWMYSQVKTYASASSTQYIDHIVDMGNFSAMMANTSTIPGNSATGGYYLAERWNRALAMQNAGDITGPPPFIFSNGGLSSTGTHGLMFWQGTTDNNYWYFLNRDQSTNMFINGDLHQNTIYSSDVNNPPRVENDLTNGIYDMWQLYAPNIVSGITNYRQVSACWTWIAGATWYNCATNGTSTATQSITLGANAVPPNSFSGWPASGIMLFANGSVRFPGVVAGSGTQPLQVDTSGNLSVGSGGGGGLNGTVTYTTSTTASTSDNGKLVIMNCASACAYTLPATQPSTTWNAWVTTQGAAVATIVLGGSDTFNGSLSVPVLNSFRILSVWANSATATDYRGDAPMTASSPIVLTPSSNGFNVSCPTCSVGSGTNVTVNGGAVLGTANLNDTTPVAASNGLNVKWQTSTSNVSAYVPGDGTATHFLNGTGAWSTPPGGGPSPFTVTLTGASADQSLTSCLSSSYNDYEIEYAVVGASSSPSVGLVFNNDTTSGDYIWSANWTGIGPNIDSGGPFRGSTTYFNLAATSNTATLGVGYQASGSVQIQSTQSTAVDKAFQYTTTLEQAGHAGGTFNYTVWGSGVWGPSSIAAVTGLTFHITGGSVNGYVTCRPKGK